MLKQLEDRLLMRAQSPDFGVEFEQTPAQYLSRTARARFRNSRSELRGYLRV